METKRVTKVIKVTTILALLLINMLTVALHVPSIVAGISITELPSYSPTVQETEKNNPSNPTDSRSAFSYNDSKNYSLNGKTQTAEDSLSYCVGRKWNFNDTNQWSTFAYADGNRTRLIVGVNGGKHILLELEKIAAKHQAKVVNTVSIGGQVRAAVVELLFGSVTAFVEEIRIVELASYIEPNMKFQAQLVPNDPYWSMQWGPQRIEADWAWNTTVGDPSVLVAVADTGIDYTHPDLATNYFASGYDWVNMDTDPADDHGHGTHCAGIVAATINNSVGIAGLAQVRVMAEKVLDSGAGGYEDWVANGIIHATDCGADIISMSLGGYGYSELMHDAVRYAYDSGVLVIAAAGNDNTDMKLYPAGYDEVIAVAATDQYDSKASFSNWGDWIELTAPGVDIYSTVPWGYESWSGTSMATPHVSGMAALVWSRHPNKTRDWMRLWLRCTTDDLGDPGFDVYYGYGRVNARKAVEQTPPAHELMAYEWRTPPYMEPGALGVINATVLNFGENNETDVTVQLLANGAVADSAVISFLASGNLTTVSLLWNPTVEGLYNVTLYVVPAPGETSLENNVVWKYIYVGFPVKAVVLHSAGNIQSDIITNWQVLNNEWHLFGDTMILIDYTTLNKEDITYTDIASTEADVLIISCASDPYAGWEFTDSEIEAIERYVHEEHGLIATAGTFYYSVPNNNKLAPLFGLSETTMWASTGTDLLHLLNTTHPIFTDVPNPLIFPPVGTTLPYDGQWDLNELVDGKYLALGHYQESAIVTYRGLVYISPLLEIIPPYYHHHLQLLYNAITWSSYQRPEHEVVASLEAPTHVEPEEPTLLNATVSNLGRNNETDVELQISIDGILVDSMTVSELTVDSSCNLSYLWTPTVQGIYNVTAYAPPKPGEEFTGNNIATKMVTVLFIVVRNILVYTDDAFVEPSSRYVIVALNNLGINYTYYADDPSGFGWALVSQPWDLVIVDHYNYYAVGSYWTELEEYVHNGGLLVLSTFDIDGSHSESTTLWDTLGARWVSDMFYSPEPVYQWIPSHSIFTFPNMVGNITSYLYWGAVDYGDHVAATTGTPIAGFTTTPIEDYAAIVVGNTYPTVLFSFCLDDFRYDDDGDGKLDAIELWENAIIYLARGYEHDLAVTLDVPKLVKPGESALFNATVHNRGLSNETNVELQLVINSTIVDSIIISELLTGESYILSYSWPPALEGIYNVTAYAPPVANETITANNWESKFVMVSYQISIAILHASTYNSDVHSKLDSYPDLSVTSINVRYDGIIPTLSTLLEYDAVLVYSDSQFKDPVALGDALADYVDNGGGVVLATFSWFNGVALHGRYMTDQYGSFVEESNPDAYKSGSLGAVLEPDHQIMDGVKSLYTPNFRYTDTSLYPESLLIAKWDDGANLIAVHEFDGHRTADIGFYPPSSDIRSDFWDSSTDGALILHNALVWAQLPPYEHDLAISLEAPALLEFGASVLLNATARNRGLNNETNVELQLLINGTIVNFTLIPELLVGESYTLSHLWTPTVEGVYNVTAYAPPMPDEGTTVNNVATKIVSVRSIKYVLFDQTHGTDSITSYSIWVASLIERGYVVETNIIEPITPIVLEGYDVFIIPQAYSSYTVDELLAIQNFVFNGGGLLVIGDDNPWIYTDLTSFAGITWASGGASGITTDITSHPVTTGVSSVYLSGPIAIMYVAGGAQDLVRDPAHNIMLAVSEQLSGNVIGFADEDSLWNYAISQADNLRLANNMIDWLTSPIRFEHDLAVSLDAPSFLELGDTSLLNASVRNRGLNNETGVEIYLIINGTVASFETIPELLVGESHTICYMWTPTSTGNYNITAHTPPVQEEEYITNNIETKTVCVFFYTRLYFPHEWVGGGVPMGWHSDDASWSYDLPFDFPFYGIYYRTIYISSNGLIAFIEPDSSYWNSIPELASRLAIAPAWDDWETYMPHDIYIWQPDSTSIVVRWEVAALYNSSIAANFEVILNSNGIIQCNYEYNNGPISATIGISNGADHIIAEDATSLNYINTIVFTPWLTGTHNIAVVNVTPFKTIVSQGYTLNINVTIANQGSFPETFNVTIYADLNATSVGDEITVGMQDVTLTSENATTLVFPWNTTGVAKGNYTITAEATTVPEETDLDDNILIDGIVMITIPGDVNGDRQVDVFDKALVGGAFGSTYNATDGMYWHQPPDFPEPCPYCPHPPIVDLNGDGVVDLFDIVIISTHFGEGRE